MSMSAPDKNAPTTVTTTASAVAADVTLTPPVAPKPCNTPATAPPSTSASTSAAASALIISATNKAGMSHIDRQLIDSILLRESGDSPYMKRQRKLDDNTNLKVQSIRSKLQQKNERDARWKQHLIDSTLTPLLNSHIARATVEQPLSTVAVIDMDSFFISCHILTHPRLSSVPACVGGPSMISTSNYPARKYGVRAAMPGYIGKILVKELSGGKEELVFVKSDYELYERKSGEVRRVLEEYDPGLRMGGLDEGVLDLEPYLELLLEGVDVDAGVGNEDDTREDGIVDWSETRHEMIRDVLWKRQGKFSNATPSASETAGATTTATGVSATQSINNPLSTHPPSIIHKTAQALLRTIRRRVHAITGLTCSAGLASNPLLAKIASDVHKPNGQCFVGPSQQEIRQFLHPMPIRKVGGIGRVMEKLLREGIGVDTVGDLYEKRAEVWTSFGEKTVENLMRICVGFRERGGRGIGSGGILQSTNNGDNDLAWDDTGGVGDKITQKQQQQQRKGISHERTFTPTSSWSEMCTKLEAITYSLVKDLTERDLKPKTISLNIKLANFEVLSKAMTREVAFFSHGYNSRESRDLVDVVVKLLKEAKRAYREKTNKKSEKILFINPGGIDGGGKQNPFKDENNKSGGETFCVRLLGVRCSNFQFEKDNQSLLHQFCKPDKDNPTTNAKSEEPMLQPIGVTSKPEGNNSISNSRNNTPLRVNPYRSPTSTTSSDKSPRKILCTPTSRRNLYGNTVDDSSNSTINPSLEQAFEPDVAASIAVETEPPKNEQIQCPICTKIFLIKSNGNHDGNVEINSHIDSCLSSSAVKQLAKEETILSARSKQRLRNGDSGNPNHGKRRKLTDFFDSL